jgi:hypothetical protein
LTKETRIYHTILYGLFLTIISIPLLYDLVGNKEKITPLQGAYEQPVALDFSVEGWMNQSYQQNRDSIFKYNALLRPTLVRLYNELDYRCFGKANMGDLLIGKDEYLFSMSWAESRAGKVSLDSIQLSVFCGKLARLEQLLEERDIYFKFVIPPSKEEIFSAYLPSHLQSEGAVNDYKLLTHYLKHHKVSFDDLTEYYRDLADKENYPVYSKTSVHWTMYGAHFTLISLLNEMNDFFGNEMISLKVDELKTDYFCENDGDQEKTLNLFMRLDNTLFAYPIYSREAKNPDPFRPKVITIGDSYYWGIIGSWQLLHIFSPDSKYLYYYNTVYPNNDDASYSIKDINVVEEISTADAFILINSSHNLVNFPYGFEQEIDSIIAHLESVEPNIP